jgi:hypothetical protein
VAWKKRFELRGVKGALCAGATVILAACTSNNPGAAPPAPTCTDGGAAASGPPDTHCAGRSQSTNMAIGSAGEDSGIAGDDGGGGDDGGSAIGNCGDPAYQATMFGNQGGDDACKYDVSWTAPPICEKQPIYFTVSVKSRTDHSAVTSANVRPDVVLNCSHPTPAMPADPSPESPPGTYRVGPVVFDMPGRWVVRFHIHSDCFDILPTSPHGHAAFWVDVP